MQQSPSQEANSTTANQAIRHIVCNMEVHIGASLVLSYPLLTGHHPDLSCLLLFSCWNQHCVSHPPSESHSSSPLSSSMCHLHHSNVCQNLTHSICDVAETLQFNVTLTTQWCVTPPPHNVTLQFNVTLTTQWCVTPPPHNVTRVVRKFIQN